MNAVTGVAHLVEFPGHGNIARQDLILDHEYHVAVWLRLDVTDPGEPIRLLHFQSVEDGCEANIVEQVQWHAIDGTLGVNAGCLKKQTKPDASKPGAQ